MCNLLSPVDDFSRYNSEIERASLTVKPAAGWSPSSPHRGGVCWSAATAAFLRLGAEAGVRRKLSAVPAGIGWEGALVVGFIAGVLERLVLALLDKATAQPLEALRNPATATR
jgi:hypothetical protein